MGQSNGLASDNALADPIDGSHADESSSGRRGGRFNWDDPIPLSREPAPEMDDIIPGIVGEMVNAAAAAFEVPRDLPATFGVTSLAIAGQGRFAVVLDNGYAEPLAFWSICALKSGNRKSPTHNAMMGWAHQFARIKAIAMAPEIRRAEAAMNIANARVKSMRQKAASLDDAVERSLLIAQAAEEEDAIQSIPIPPRLTVEDITNEHAATLMSQQQERIGVTSDETGPLGAWGGRYYSNKGSNIDLPLKAYSGTPADIDRGSRPSVHLAAPLMTIGLSPQPSVVSALVGNQEYRSRGFVGRFYIFMPDSRLGYRTLNTTPIPDALAEQYAAHLTALAEMNAVPDGRGVYRPRQLSLSGEAYGLWRAFAIEVEAMMRPTGALEQLTDIGGKMPGSAARAAGLFHLAKHGPNAAAVDVIDIETMDRAIRFARHAIEHARYVYDESDPSGELELARRIWAEMGRDARVEERKGKNRNVGIVTARQMWNPLRGRMKAVKEMEPALRRLIDHNYLRELPTPEMDKPGRPQRRFEINPRLTVEWE
ncbi:MAG TPA: YfjI family protein [Tepidisphaeraceae bacterium]|nr:YfjI family protein [Tepidisphaeraceae bacterium]